MTQLSADAQCCTCRHSSFSHTFSQTTLPAIPPDAGMAYRRRYSRRTRYGRKRPSYRRKARSSSTRRVASRALKIAKAVQRRAWNERQELRRGGTFTVSSATPYTFLLNNTEAGNAESERTGEDYNGIGALITLDINVSTEPATSSWYRRARVLVYCVKSSIGGGTTSPSWDQILDSTQNDGAIVTNWSSLEADQCSYLRVNVPQNIEVLRDFLVKIDMDSPHAQRRVYVPFKRLVKQMEFTGLSDYLYTNQLWLMVIPLDTVPTAGSGQMFVTWSSRFDYYES